MANNKRNELTKKFFELLEKFYSDNSIKERQEKTAVLEAQQSHLKEDLKTKCEAYNKQQETGDEILIAKLDCNDPVAVAKIFTEEAKAVDEIAKKIEELNKPPDLSELIQLIKKIISSSKK